MSFLISTNCDSRSASEILYKYLVKTELLRNAFLDELNQNFFEKVEQSFHNQLSTSSITSLEKIETWNLYGINLIEKIHADVEDDEEDLEIEIENETFRGSLDRCGNGYGKLEKIDPRNGLCEHSAEGTFMSGVLEGKVRETYFSTSYRDIYYHEGRPHGFYRKFRIDNKFEEMGVYVCGHLFGPFITKCEGNSYIIGLHPSVDETKNVISNCSYIYPDLESCIAGTFMFKKKSNKTDSTKIVTDMKLENGKYGKITGISWLHGFPIPMSSTINENSFSHDPSTGMRISRSPLLEDPYEQETVYVAQSKIGEAAGEGLYAKKHIRKGQLVCLFNGIRCNKTGHHTRITAEDEDWSDYRLTLDRSTDLDIPLEFIHLSEYNATLGHKACHSFGEDQNSRFENLYHPRFGQIMSIISCRNIAKDEEILVSYNYELYGAPQWYKDLWQNHKSRKRSTNP